MSITTNLKQIQLAIPENVTLVAVSKTKPNEAILEAYQTGQRIFGENKVQELTDKFESLPKDIEWHMIGHLQSNKVKYIAPFVSLIHGVDSFKLLKEINKRAAQNNRTINCLLQIHIAEEETKFGFDSTEVTELIESEKFKGLQNVNVIGLMGMATFTDNEAQIKKEFSSLQTLFTKLKNQHPKLNTLSMGMSGDYQLAIECGSTMIRVGSSIFGNRN
ncbi:YggS family pyridoxal phosphate-dependent enzyme [Vicingus serpentipes]|uniref:Pyridoxal phosphate homeostasis protein n=1 Tax=Vicingus serpentipes TaxID=1926625 RepID=A0A5C6RXD1_9FLAO|nr:YggS family pyridoxal phosphate-dependent enzyme [Vicingus serpentipes]TXB66012.1 YggS family pyridoxal phosphate-dependent enzyme [Vicingus serpentipes]